MKVLQVNCVYKKGSTGKIVYDIHTELKNREIASIVCYGRGKKINEENVYKVSNELYSKLNQISAKCTGLLYGGCFFSTSKLCSIIKREQPDVVHLHCINGYFVNIYRLIQWLKVRNIRTVITLHAEFMHTANCGHAFECEKWKTGCGKCSRNKTEIGSLLFDSTHRSWKKMKKAFEGFENIQILSVSSWLMERAKNSPILSALKHDVVLNGVETQIFKRYDEKHNLPEIKNNTKVIFHATPNFNDDPNNNKGGYFVLKLAEDLKDENVHFIIAGKYNSDLIVPSTVTLLGRVADQTQLAQYYSMADLTLLTSKRETFSMVTAESLCCGTPVVGFCSGAPEQICIKDYCKFVEFGNLNELKRSVLEVLNTDWDKDIISRVAKEKYNKERMIEKYLEHYIGD